MTDKSKDLLRSTPHDRALVAAAIRYTFIDTSSTYDELIAPVIVDFLSLMQDENLVRRHWDVGLGWFRDAADTRTGGPASGADVAECGDPEQAAFDSRPIGHAAAAAVCSNENQAGPAPSGAKGSIQG